MARLRLKNSNGKEIVAQKMVREVKQSFVCCNQLRSSHGVFEGLPRSTQDARLGLTKASFFLHVKFPIFTYI